MIYGELDMNCELCDYGSPLILIDSGNRFNLCPNHLLKLVTHNLSRKEFINLVSNHGNTTHYLHDDFYDEKGRSLQPM